MEQASLVIPEILNLFLALISKDFKLLDKISFKFEISFHLFQLVCCTSSLFINFNQLFGNLLVLLLTLFELLGYLFAFVFTLLEFVVE